MNDVGTPECAAQTAARSLRTTVDENAITRGTPRPRREDEGYNVHHIYAVEKKITRAVGIKNDIYMR